MNKLIAVLLMGGFMGCGKLQHSVQTGMAPQVHALVSVSNQGTKVIIAVGQSNAEGRGQSSPFPPVDRLDFTDATHTGPFYVAAQDLLQQFQGWDKLVVLNCMDGGKQIGVFEPGHDDYEHCMANAKALQRNGAQIIGLFFFQGESDARYGYSEDWPQRFTALIANYRNDLSMDDLPVVFAQLGKLENDQYHKLQDGWNAFKAAQARIRIPGVVMVKTDDQNVIDDVHIDTAGIEVIGDRFYNAYSSLITP